MCSKHLISYIAQSSRQISDIKMNNVYNKNYKFSIVSHNHGKVNEEQGSTNLLISVANP